MTSPPLPPNRRRRKVIVAIAVLVVGLGWCFWPRVDPRFVGKWRFEPAYLNGRHDPGVSYLTQRNRADGIAEVIIHDKGEPQGRLDRKKSWWSHDDKFFSTQDPDDSWTGRFSQFFEPLVVRLTGVRKKRKKATEYTIVEIDAQHFVLQGQDGQQYRYTRYSE